MCKEAPPSDSTVAGFQQQFRLLPFWLKLLIGFACALLAPLGWIVGLVLLVVLNWRAR